MPRAVTCLRWGARSAPILLMASTLGLSSCDGDGPTEPHPDPVTFAFDFDAGSHGWSGDFVDFPPDREEDVEFVSDHRPLPGSIDDERGGLYHRGVNLSDDLFMYFKRRVEGLEPGTRYRVEFEAEFATTIGEDCLAGLALYLKAGAVPEEPVRVIGPAEGWVRLSADKGFQSDTGNDAVMLGEMRNTVPGCTGEFGLGELDSNGEALEITASDDGSTWLFFGEESVFEVPHEVYYTSFEARFEPVSAASFGT